MKQRKKDMRDAANDEARLRLYVLPVIGHMRLEEVRPRHLVEVVNAMKAKELAPRTIRNTYSVVKALFRDARIADVLTTEDPCILTHRQLGKVRDAKPGWRAAAVFSRDELVTLISDPRVPADRRVVYALLGIGMLRHGEMAGLRWDHVTPAEPLARLGVDTSYDHGRTKTEVERWMPVHPTLAAILAEWRLSGWAAAFGRPPGMDDLVVPVTGEAPRKGRMKEIGSMRDRHYTWKRAQRDLDALKLRRRRVHDLRRTGISLAKEDGAIEDILKRGTHAAPTHVMALYTSVEWSALCREVQKLRVSRPTRMLAEGADEGSLGGDPQP